LVLALLPLGLVVGGALGGGIGALGMVINLKIARRELGAASTAALMLGVLLAAVIAFLVAAALVGTALSGG
jgi:hypothetical protein